MSKAAELAALIGSRTALSDRNVIINGAMQVAQRSTSETGLGSANGYHTVDRWQTTAANTAGRFTQEQSADAPSGFAFSTKLSCTTADTSIAADELVKFRQKIEAQNLIRFAKGTSDAKRYALSFYVKGNANATYVAELYDADNARQISKTFNVTTSWNRVELNFPADTSGALNNDNGTGIIMQIYLHAGSTFTSGTLNSSAWAASTDANRAVGISSFFDSTSRTFFITGVQLEVGDVATPFEHRSFADELLQCQRYYYRVGDDNNGGGYHRYAVGSCQGTSSCGITVHAPVKMRTTPTLEQTGTASNYALYEADSVHACSSVPAINSAHSGPSNFNITFTSAGNLASGNAAEAINNNNTTSYLAFAAEL
tara:strand:- start:587 stop:1696 length:1110 start_codon:yes stop_codon:yes gene_type:complete